MKQKLLLTGQGNTIIDDFFNQLNNYECLCSTTNYHDLIGHLKYFKPNAIIFCMKSDSNESMKTLSNVQRSPECANIPTLIVGTQDEYMQFVQQHSGACNMHIVKPATIWEISDKLSYFFSTSTPKKAATSHNIDMSDLDISLLNKPSQSSNNISIGSQSYSIDDLLSIDMVKKHKKRILVIDDATVMLRTINEHLKDDYEVATAINGKLAQRYLESKPVDLILLDYEMPGEDGPTVFQKIHNNPATSNIPIVFLTGINESEKIQKALSLRPAGYLLKPVNKDDLLAKVHEVLD